jgi:hypothetical protein
VPIFRSVLVSASGRSLPVPMMQPANQRHLDLRARNCTQHPICWENSIGILATWCSKRAPGGLILRGFGFSVRLLWIGMMHSFWFCMAHVESSEE